MNDILVPISAGELLDKITILRIKCARIDDAAKLANVRQELARLERSRAGIAAAATQTSRPRKLSSSASTRELWDIEDRIREHEAQRRFDAAFIELARAVYLRNDERAAIKRRINLKLDSALLEEKSYRPYAENAAGSALQRVLGPAVRALGEAGRLDRQINARMRIPQRSCPAWDMPAADPRCSPCTASGHWRGRSSALAAHGADYSRAPRPSGAAQLTHRLPRSR